MKGIFYTVYSSDAVFLFRIHIIATVYEWQTFVDYGSNLLGVSIYFELKLISTLWKVYRKLPCYQGKSSHNSAFFFLYTCSYEYFLVDTLRCTQEYTYWTAYHAIYSDLTDSLQTKTQNKMQLCTAPEL